MYIYIMRHATAENLMTLDEERALILDAKKEIQSTVRQLNLHTDKIDRVIHSPYRRARETFENVKLCINVDQSMESNQITPSGEARSFRKFLDLKLIEDESAGNLLIISHLPFVSYFLDELVNQNFGFFFPPASIAIIEYDAMTSVGHFVKFLTVE